MRLHWLTKTSLQSQRGPKKIRRESTLMMGRICAGVTAVIRLPSSSARIAQVVCDTRVREARSAERVQTSSNPCEILCTLRIQRCSVTAQIAKAANTHPQTRVISAILAILDGKRQFWCDLVRTRGRSRAKVHRLHV